MWSKLFPLTPLLAILSILSLPQVSECANILFFFGVSTYSHRIVVWPLVEALANKGHDVTFVQPFPPKKPHPKVKEFYPKKALAPQAGDTFGDGEIDFLNLRLNGGKEAIVNLATTLPVLGLNLCEKFLDQEETRNWVENSKFDLIIIDGLFNDCGLGLAWRFKSKVIFFGTTHPFIWLHDPFGVVSETSWAPELHMSYQYPMSFFERVKTTLLPLGVQYYKQNIFYPKLAELFRRTLGMPESVSVVDLERGANLIFTNTHFSEELARSLPPLWVSIGGMHCEDSTQKLSKELEKFIESSGKNGFIYVSFGSAAKISQAPVEFQNMFYNALGNSSMRFVWKFEGDRTPEIPKNVFVDKWMPQQAILAHPKIKAFLTHGGLLGMQEAIWHAVPLITIPIFAEQDYNGFRVQRLQRGVTLDVNKLTQEKLEDAIRTVTTDPKYKRNMVELSKKFKDRPEKPVDTAVWWTEYVLRHDDTSSLKPLGMHQTWYERRLLDVWGFVFTIILLILLTLAFITKKIASLISASKKQDRSQGKLKTK